MNTDLPEKQPKNRKRFWILTFTALATVGSFAVAAYGMIYGMVSAIGGAIVVGFVPWAGDQILDEMEKSGAIADWTITGGVVGGILFLVLFIVLYRRPA